MDYSSSSDEGDAGAGKSPASPKPPVAKPKLSLGKLNVSQFQTKGGSSGSSSIAKTIVAPGAAVSKASNAGVLATGTSGATTGSLKRPREPTQDHTTHRSDAVLGPTVGEATSNKRPAAPVPRGSMLLPQIPKVRRETQVNIDRIADRAFEGAAAKVAKQPAKT
ncbi:unnamed protein product [Amoebophrya sp. A120]|nr:unnamed protein product [Amoebophrya sp. A120]|eukprot:GSA120T00023062001.1